MTPRPTPHLFGLTLLGTLACTAPGDSRPKPANSVEGLPGLEQVFECGELDFAELWAIFDNWRTIEVACGHIPEGAPWIPEGAPWPELSWRELADQYDRLASCEPDPEAHPRWQLLRQGCGLEAALNLSIHGLRATGCPPLPGSGPSPTPSRMWQEAAQMVYEVCYPEWDSY